MNEIMAVKKLMGVVFYDDKPILDMSGYDDHWVVAIAVNCQAMELAKNQDLNTALRLMADKLLAKAKGIASQSWVEIEGIQKELDDAAKRYSRAEDRLGEIQTAITVAQAEFNGEVAK